jgi:hypothetical protein
MSMEPIAIPKARYKAADGQLGLCVPRTHPPHPSRSPYIGLILPLTHRKVSLAQALERFQGSCTIQVELLAAIPKKSWQHARCRLTITWGIKAKYEGISWMRHYQQHL